MMQSFAAKINDGANIIDGFGPNLPKNIIQL